MASSPGPADPKPSTFEAHLEALERVVADLEGDALALEAAIDRYKEGVAHLAACRRILDAAEQRLAELVATADGGVAEKPLVVGPEGLLDAGGQAASPPASDAGPKPKPRPARRAPPASTDPGDDLPF